MQRRENQMTGLGGFQCDAHGFQVAHFADQHDVRVLSQDCSQLHGESRTDGFVHRNVVHAVDYVLHRIFKCRDVASC